MPYSPSFVSFVVNPLFGGFLKYFHGLMSIPHALPFPTEQRTEDGMGTILYCMGTLDTPVSG